MTTCQSCGRENPPDRDFCECGEYLRWEPTGFVQAVTPEMAAAAAAADAPAPAEPAPPVSPAPPAGGPPQVARTQVHAAAAPPPQAAPAEAAPEPATITLRVPEEDAAKGETLAVGVHPGNRTRVLALVRNQSGIVDNYQLSVTGLPDDWWTVLPDTVYLVPYGSGGTYEQEVEIHLHPPRSAEAEARIWELEVQAHSRAHERTAARAPLLLGIQPFEDHATKVKPERASGRRQAGFKVAVRNKANAPVFVAFDASEADNDCRFAFSPPAAEIAPGQTVESTMKVKPPKQIWIGRPHERRLEVAVRTGEEAAALQAAGAEDDDGGGAGRGALDGLGGKLGVSRPQVSKPNVFLGPGGLQVQKPMVQGPHARGMNLNLGNLKLPGGGQAPPAATGPLLPTQAVFRQKPWLPWWVAIVVPLLVLLALFLFLFLPKNVGVPDVVGKKSAFEAEKAITEAGLKLAPQTKQQVDAKVPPGTVVGQTPKAGAKAKKDSEVAIQVAVGTGKASVPSVVGQVPGDAEKTLRKAGLTLGQATPQPVDPQARIRSQIPAAREVVKAGAPVDIFLTVPGKGGDAGKQSGGGAAAPAGGGGGGGGGGDATVPAIAGAAKAAYAQKAGDEGLVPKVTTAFADSPKGTLFKVVPEPGTKAKQGDPVTLFVSAGSPQLAYDNDRDILLVDSASGKPLKAIAKGAQDEHDPAWSADGSAVAYTSDGQVFLADRVKLDAVPKALSKQGERFSDLAWAPTANVNALAMAKITGNESDLCLGKIDASGMTTRCKSEPGFSIERKINWAPNGRSIVAWGFKSGSEFGMVQWKTTIPFSTNPDDYGAGKFVTDITRPGQGVLDAAPSPDGKRMAIINLGKNGRPELMLAKPTDFLLSDAKPLGVVACKVIWRPDGLELVVVRSDDCFASGTGDLVRLPVDDPKSQRSLRLGGDNPVFQPLSGG